MAVGLRGLLEAERRRAAVLEAWRGVLEDLRLRRLAREAEEAATVDRSTVGRLLGFGRRR